MEVAVHKILPVNRGSSCGLEEALKTRLSCTQKLRSPESLSRMNVQMWTSPTWQTDTVTFENPLEVDVVHDEVRFEVKCL